MFTATDRSSKLTNVDIVYVYNSFSAVSECLIKRLICSDYPSMLHKYVRVNKADERLLIIGATLLYLYASRLYSANSGIAKQRQSEVFSRCGGKSDFESWIDFESFSFYPFFFWNGNCS